MVSGRTNLAQSNVDLIKNTNHNIDKMKQLVVIQNAINTFCIYCLHLDLCAVSVASSLLLHENQTGLVTLFLLKERMKVISVQVI